MSTIVNEAVNNEITKCQVKDILAEKCGSEELPKGSKMCRAIGEGHHY
jgi:hypothetical protein